MVTKQQFNELNYIDFLILAKIHMATKQAIRQALIAASLILAKIHMVTKPQTHNTICI